LAALLLASTADTGLTTTGLSITSRNAGETMFRFKCTCCGEWHEGMPVFSADAPLYFYSIPADQRDDRCLLD